MDQLWAKLLLINILLTLFYASESCSGGPKPKPKPKVYEKLPPKQKTMRTIFTVPGVVGPPPIPKHKMLPTIQPHTNATISKSKLCHNLKPGFEHLAVGVRMKYFASNESDRQPPLSPFLQFTCAEGKQIAPNNISAKISVPDQFEDFRAAPHLTYNYFSFTFKDYVKIITSFPSTLVGFWNTYVKHEAYLKDSRENNFKRLTQYLRDEYEVTLCKHMFRTSLRPAFVADMDGLPDEYFGNEWLYHSLIVRYGTEFYQSVRLGGQYYLVVDYSNEVDNMIKPFNDRDPLINAESKFDITMPVKDQYEKYILSRHISAVGGDPKLKLSLDEWGSSVRTAPLPTSGYRETLDTLFDNKKKSESFRQAIEHEELTQELKKLLVHFENLKNRDTLTSKLQDIALVESSTITPRREVVYSLKKAFNSGSNLDQTFLLRTCPQWEQWAGFEHKLHVLKEICTQPTMALAKCGDTNWEFHPADLCVQVYSTTSCTGVPTIVTEPNKLEHHLSNHHVSLQLCD